MAEAINHSLLGSILRVMAMLAGRRRKDDFGGGADGEAKKARKLRYGHRASDTGRAILPSTLLVSLIWPGQRPDDQVLLHCQNERLRAARAEAWEGKDPGCVRTSLANPRWEQLFLLYFELSGVGRVIADGADE